MMILCLVGTSPYDFKRLIETVDKKIGCNYEVLIQKGYSKYECINAKCFDFINKKELEILISKAKIIISQGGYGSMMDCILQNKPVIAVPRKEELNELVGNQLELVKYFETKEYVVGCYDVELLESLLQQTLNGSFKFKKFKPESKNLIRNVISKYLEDI